MKHIYPTSSFLGSIHSFMDSQYTSLMMKSSLGKFFSSSPDMIIKIGYRQLKAISPHIKLTLTLEQTPSFELLLFNNLLQHISLIICY